MNGNYEKGRSFAGSLGGQLMQLIISFQILNELQNPADYHPEEGAAPRKCPADIANSLQLIGFLVSYLKDLKNESGLVIQIS